MNHSRCDASDYCQLYQGRTAGVCHPTEAEMEFWTRDKTDGRPVPAPTCPHYTGEIEAKERVEP